MDLVEQVCGSLHLLRQGSVLVHQVFDVVGVLLGVNGDLRGNRIGAFGGDQEGSRLDTGQHGQEQVEQDVGIGIEPVLAVGPAQIEDRVGDRPEDHHGEETEHEGPRAHHAAHAVRRPLTNGELIAGAHARMSVPVRLPATRPVHARHDRVARLRVPGFWGAGVRRRCSDHPLAGGRLTTSTIQAQSSAS